ncbi:MAG: NAD(P)-dependent oxidoreductase [Candidatus Marinimicrobia bacterium]|nr:NAD(P)-dependent oxidoreductase [Candidatus Neomarinimicrobiota bacterium]
MVTAMAKEWIINKADRILITGANGFVGSKVFEILLEYGFTKIRCLLRSDHNLNKLQQIAISSKANVEFLKGDLLSKADCLKATKDVSVIYHLAIGSGGKSFANSFMHAVIPTRNLLEAAVQNKLLKRFVNISSFAIYSNSNKPQKRLLDELCPIDPHPEERADAYAFAKLKQDEIVLDYSKKSGINYVILLPGVVYGPGKKGIPGRVGIDTFGIFMHLGGSNKVPLTYVDNCAKAIVLAGFIKGIDGEVFNIVDDDLPSSRRLLSLYKQNVKYFKSIFIPHALSYLLFYLWEKYSTFSEGQLPPVYCRKEWHAYWKKTAYSNEKLKGSLGWKMKVPTEEGLKRYFEYCREGGEDA